jgi:serine/threonine protein kinase
MSALPTAIGRFQVREQLHHDGPGQLYLCVDPQLDRAVAVRVFAIGDARRREAFEREARLLLALSHPNIVTVFDVGIHNGSVYWAMERVDGETLAELIARRAPLPVSSKISMIRDVCRGLAHARERGVTTLDVTPTNLWVHAEGTIKIVGLPLPPGFDEDITRDPTERPDIPYLPPEKIAGAPVDERSTVYTVGVVLYELLAYRRPFVGKNTLDTANRILQSHAIRTSPRWSVSWIVSPRGL